MKTFIVTGSFIQIVDTSTGVTRMIESEAHPRQYNTTLKLITAGQLDEAFEEIANVFNESTNIDVIRTEVKDAIVNEKTKGRFKLQHGEDGKQKLFYVDSLGALVQVHGEFLDRVLTIFNDDGDITPIDNFLKKAEANAYSAIAAADLFEFLAVNNHPITTDGDFLAFKIVAADLKDMYTGTISHDVGSIIAIDPASVDFNRDQTCSSGLHFCSRDYLPHYGGFYGRRNDCALLVLKISPSDVAAFPRDYRNAKGRAVKYQVLAQLPNNEYHKVIEYLLSSPVVDVAAELSDVSMITTRVYRQLNETDFEEVVEKAVSEVVEQRSSSRGPIPTVVYGRWTVYAKNTGTGRSYCVANASTRQRARDIRDEYNRDYGTQTTRYIVVEHN